MNSPSICTQEMSKPMKPLSQDNSLPGKDSKHTPSKYKCRLLTLHHLLCSQLNFHTWDVYYKKKHVCPFQQEVNYSTWKPAWYRPLTLDKTTEIKGRLIPALYIRAILHFSFIRPFIHVFFSFKHYCVTKQPRQRSRYVDKVRSWTIRRTTRQCAYDATMGRVRTIIVAVEKQ